MGNEYARIVDQQLAYTRVQLNAARASESTFSHKACLNASCLHLMESVLVYLSELQLRSVLPVKNESSLCVIFDELRSLPSSADFRMNELVALAFDNESWLSTLIRLQLFLRKPVIPEQKGQSAGELQDDHKLIATSSRPSQGKPAVEPTIDLVANILEEMKTLIVRHREFSAEY